MPEHDGFLIFLERTPLWKDFLVNTLKDVREPSFPASKVHSIPTFLEAAEFFVQAPHSLLIAEIVPGELPPIISGVVRLKNRYPGARFAAYAPELMKMSPVEYDQTWELLFQSGFFAVITSFTQLSHLAESVLRHFQFLDVPQPSVVDRIWNTLPWHEQVKNE